MDDPRKKPGWAFWSVIAVAAMLFYVASFGPACWLLIKSGRAGNIGAKRFIESAYSPLFWTADHFQPLESYWEWWARFAARKRAIIETLD